MKEALKLALEALEIVDDSCPKDINEGETAVLVALSVAEVEAIRSVIGLVRLVVQPDPLADTGKVIERIDIDSRTIEVWPARVGQEPEPSSECNPQDLCAGCRCKYGAQPPLPVQPVQEPVATMKMLHTYGDTTPPKRPWVGLTDDEIEYWIGCNTSKPALVRAISKALKDKNT